MLYASVHKDLTKYKPKIIAGLSMRTLLCIVCAIGFSVLIGAYAWFVLGLDFDHFSYAAIILSIPFWLLGFWEPEGMALEKWLPLKLRHEFGTSQLKYSVRERYESEGLLPTQNERNIHVNNEYRRFAKKQRALELWSPEDTD